MPGQFTQNILTSARHSVNKDNNRAGVQFLD